MVNPLSAERVDELNALYERSKPNANGISRDDVLALCATARYWRRKLEHLERVTTGELAAVA